MLDWLARRNRSSVNFRTDQKRKQEPDKNRINQPKEQPNKNPTERKPPINNRQDREERRNREGIQEGNLPKSRRRKRIKAADLERGNESTERGETELYPDRKIMKRERNPKSHQ